MTTSAEERVPLDPRQPFTRADLRAAGLSEDVLASGRFDRVWWDTYVERGIRVTPLLRAKAALRLAPATARVSHHTAAEIWGAPVPSDPHTHLTLPSARKRLVRRGIRSHYGGGSEHTLRKGVRVSTPEQTFVELAVDGIGLVDLVAVGDSLVAAGHTTTKALIEAATAYGGRGCRVARRAAGLVRVGVDSPMETRLRLLLVLAGLPEPEVNVVMRADDGSWQRRFDLAYKGLRIVVEYDGRQHADDAAQWNADIYRREELELKGWRVIIITAEGIYRDPERTLDRVRGALQQSEAPALPRRYRAEWRLHFPTNAPS